MKKYLVSCTIALSAILSVNAQSVLETWEGTYEGEMIVGLTNRLNDTVNVKFELLPIEADSSWTYKMTYDSRQYGIIVKDYEIHRDGNSTKNFLLDEKDGIIIEMSLMNDCFYEMFEVMDQLYSVTMRKIGDDIQFDLFTAAMKKAMVTNSDPDEEGNSYEVTSYKPTQHQTAILKRSTIK